MSDYISILFNKPGYVSIKDYIEDIKHMRKNSSWKLPLGVVDSLNLFLMSVVTKFSWFADVLYIVHTSNVSPACTILLSYLKKKNFYDSITERNLYCPGYFSYYLEKRVTINNRIWTISGQGVGENKPIALSRAIGEMIERAVSGMYDMNKDVLIKSQEELIKTSLIFYPPNHHRFLNIQKERFDELNNNKKDEIKWVQGMNLISKRKTYVPKQLTSWFYENRNLKKSFINATTNGSAGYFTKDGAVLRGLLEVIQRDAFLVHWLTGIPPRIILKETFPENIQKKIEEFELLGITLYILDVTDIPVPSVFIAAINDKSEDPQVVLSGSSAVTFNEATHNALREMIIASEMFYYKGSGSQLKYKDIEYEPFVSNTGKIARQLYWRGVEKVKRFEWFISGEKISYDELCQKDLVTSSDDYDQLKKCLEVLQELGEDYHPVVYYPKNKVQDDLGFYVAQVFIPKAFPLYLVERYGTFDSDRLKEFTLSKGVHDWKLNPLPHMFS